MLVFRERQQNQFESSHTYELACSTILKFSPSIDASNVKTGGSNLFNIPNVLELPKKTKQKIKNPSLQVNKVSCRSVEFSSHSADVYCWVNTKADPHNLVESLGKRPAATWQTWTVWTYIHFSSQNNLTWFQLTNVGGLLQSFFSSLDSCLLRSTSTICPFLQIKPYTDAILSWYLCYFRQDFPSQKLWSPLIPVDSPPSTSHMAHRRPHICAFAVLILFEQETVS